MKACAALTEDPSQLPTTVTCNPVTGPSTSPGLSGTPVHTRIHTHTIIKINLEKENYWIEIYSTIKFEGFSRKIYNFLKIMLYINKEILQILIVNSIIKVASVYHCVNSFSFFF